MASRFPLLHTRDVEPTAVDESVDARLLALEAKCLSLHVAVWALLQNASLSKQTIGRIERDLDAWGARDTPAARSPTANSARQLLRDLLDDLRASGETPLR